MTAHLRHPALILAALGAVSGILGTTLLGVGYGDAPRPGVYMVMTGVWFGLVIGFAVWRWGNRSWAAVATAMLATWIGWEAAVNLALQLDGPWLDGNQSRRRNLISPASRPAQWALLRRGLGPRRSRRRCGGVRRRR